MRKGRVKGGVKYVLEWTLRRIEFAIEVGKSTGSLDGGLGVLCDHS